MADDDQPEEDEGEPEQEKNQYGGGDQKLDAVEQTKRVTSGSDEDNEEADQNQADAE